MQFGAAHRDDPNREYLLWIDGFRQTGPAPQGVKVIDLCDRGADTFEVLAHETANGRTFVIRSKLRPAQYQASNRACFVGKTDG